MGYPGDPNNNETFWWAGYGQLTEEGLRQHHALGRWFRHRYNGVLPPRFDSRKLVARSTDVDRTLNSAEANLAGIFGDYYDSHPKQQFREGLPWRPTPIHTVPGSLDTLLAVGAACPELLRLEKQLLQEPFVVNYTMRLKPLMRTLTAQLRVNFSSIVDVGMAYDNFNIQRSYKLPLPGWVLPLMPQLEEVQRFSFFLLAPTPALKRLRAGPLLAKIIQEFHEKQTLQTPDFLMYSAHDTNVAEMLQAFDMYTDVKPPFASALLFELHHIHDDFFVRLYYHNDTSLMSSLHPLTLRGCDFTCSLADFETLLDPVILRDFESQCQRQSDEQIWKLPQLMTGTGRPSAALFENANGALMNTTLQNQSIEQVTTNQSHDFQIEEERVNSTTPFDSANESHDVTLEATNKRSEPSVEAVNENQNVSKKNRNTSIVGVSEDQRASSNATNSSTIDAVCNNQSFSVDESNSASIYAVTETKKDSFHEKIMNHNAMIDLVIKNRIVHSGETHGNGGVEQDTANGHRRVSNDQADQSRRARSDSTAVLQRDMSARHHERSHDKSASDDERSTHDKSALHDERSPHAKSAPHDECSPCDKSAPHDESTPQDKSANYDESGLHDESEPHDESAPYNDYAPHDESAFHDESAPHDEPVLSYDPPPKALLMALIPLVFLCTLYVLFRMVSGICKLWNRYRNRRDYDELF